MECNFWCLPPKYPVWRGVGCCDYGEMLLLLFFKGDFVVEFFFTLCWGGCVVVQVRHSQLTHTKTTWRRFELQDIGHNEVMSQREKESGVRNRKKVSFPLLLGMITISHLSRSANRGKKICKGYQPPGAFWGVNTKHSRPFLKFCNDRIPRLVLIFFAKISYFAKTCL